MRVIKYYFLLFISALAIQGCEKDDICAATTPTTPQLIIRFYDDTNQSETKTVTNLFAFGLDDNNAPVDLIGLAVGTKDSLVLPLRTDKAETRFMLISDSDGTSTIGNIDTVTVSYIKEDIYVSRACGYKAVFTDLDVDPDIDSDNWILSKDIINTTVENETSAHVKIYH